MRATYYSRKDEGNKKLSENFTVAEFACNDGSDPVLIDSNLVTLLQKIRDKFGPVTITSGYRTPAYNKKVGGVSNSQHVKGTAADIVVPAATPEQVAQYAEYLQPSTGGIGLYTTFTHVDVRANRSRWDNRSGKEVVVSGFPGYEEEKPLTKEEAKAIIKEKAGLEDKTIEFLDCYEYDTELLTKLAKPYRTNYWRNVHGY